MRSPHSPDKDSVSVGFGLRHVNEGEVAGGPDLVLDDDGPAKEGAHVLGEVAREHVGAAAGWIRRDHVHLAGRIGVLREGCEIRE